MKIYVVTPRMGGKDKSCSQSQSYVTQLLNASNMTCTDPFDMCHNMKALINKILVTKYLPVFWAFFLFSSPSICTQILIVCDNIKLQFQCLEPNLAGSSSDSIA